MKCRSSFSLFSLGSCLFLITWFYFFHDIYMKCTLWKHPCVCFLFVFCFLFAALRPKNYWILSQNFRVLFMGFLTVQMSSALWPLQTTHYGNTLLDQLLSVYEPKNIKWTIIEIHFNLNTKKTDSSLHFAPSAVKMMMMMLENKIADAFHAFECWTDHVK